MKAVIPVAGLGTRMLPATKAIPKEMLPIVDKPLIQYVVNEAVQAGIREIVLVTHASKNSIENHFDTSFELEATLEKRVKRQLLEEIRGICPADVTIMHVRQGEAKGLGHAVLCAYPCVGDAPFAVLLPDVLIDQYQADLSKHNLAAMVSVFEQTQRNQVMVEPVAPTEVQQYGIVGCAEPAIQPNQRTKITELVEKPTIEAAPSNLAIVGRYVFSKALWPILKETPVGTGGEIQLTDAIAQLAHQEVVEAYHIVGKSHDCGNKAGFMRAHIEYGLRHPEVKEELLAVIQEQASFFGQT